MKKVIDRLLLLKRRKLSESVGVKKRMMANELMRKEQHCHNVYLLLDDSSENNEETSDVRYKESSGALPKKRKYNKRGISSIVLDSIRHDIELL